MAIPADDLVMVAIPPLGADGVPPEIHWGEVVDAIGRASSTALTLYRTESGREVTKRFTVDGRLGLVHAIRTGAGLRLMLDQAAVHRYAELFPPHRHDLLLVVARRAELDDLKACS